MKHRVEFQILRALEQVFYLQEWFENWDMSIAQRAVNTFHTDRQWHILFLNTRVLKLRRASNVYCKMVLSLKEIYKVVTVLSLKDNRYNTDR